MTYIVNTYGSPGCGKTTLCARLFAALKDLGVNAYFTMEVVKTWCIEGKGIGNYGQFVLFGQEAERQSRLFNKVDIGLIDSPVGLSGFYNYYYSGKKDNSLSPACKEFYRRAEEDGVKMINLFLSPQKPYDGRDRYQTEEQAQDVHKALKKWLDDEGYDYIDLKCKDEERLEVVMGYLRDLTNNFEGMKNG